MVGPFKEKSENLIVIMDLSVDQIHNEDVSSLFWKSCKGITFVHQDEDEEASGRKNPMKWLHLSME